MNAENMKVLVNVIGAVESGGQMYGWRDYAAYEGPYANSPIEHTVTLGWAQNYGNEARKLVQMIYDADPEGFRKADDAGIASVLQVDWEATRWYPTDAQRTALIRLISTEAGKRCQDELFSMLMEGYISDCAARYTADVKAQMMYCEIRHLGGQAAADRIFGRLGGDYSLDAIMASLVRDQQDTSNDNQVGDAKYWPRHIKCRTFIDSYAVDEASMRDAADVACDWMEAAARDSSHGYDQAYRWGERGDYDCSSAVIMAYQSAGVPVKDAGATYTGNMKAAFLKCGFVDVTQQVNLSTGTGLVRGDVLLNEVHHTAMYCGGGQEVEASINELGTATGGRPGDQTGGEFLIRRYRNYPWDCVLRYHGGVTAGMDMQEEAVATCRSFSVAEVQEGSWGASVLLLQKLLRGMGHLGADSQALELDGEFGPNTGHALRSYQERAGLEVDGIAGPMTWGAIVGL